MLTRSLSKLMLDSPTNIKLVPVMKETTHHFILPDYLLLIPEEILTHIFSFLSLSDIGMLCLTGSFSLRNRVMAWITTTSCCKKVTGSLTKEKIKQQAGYEEWLRSNHQFGLLCKRASMLYSTSTRLMLLSSWYSRLECIVSDWAKLWGRLGLAAATSSFSLGWDEAEFGKLVDWVVRVEGGLVGDRRRILRIFFWEFVENEDTKVSWLSYFIRTFTITTSNIPAEKQAAKMLYLLLGPSEEDFTVLPCPARDYNSFQLGLHTRLEGKPDWNIMQEHIPTSYSKAKEMFSDLGKALRLLIRCPSINRSFLTSIMSALFNELHWEMDNQAACLLFSCEAVVKLFCTNLACKKDGIVKLSQLLVAMLVVCGRLSNSIGQGIDKILDWCFVLLEGGERKKMISEFWKEVAERVEEGDMMEDILVQLGVFVGGRAYGCGSDTEKAVAAVLEQGE